MANSLPSKHSTDHRQVAEDLALLSRLAFMPAPDDEGRICQCDGPHRPDCAAKERT